jgi:hypothetical protein
MISWWKIVIIKMSGLTSQVGVVMGVAVGRKTSNYKTGIVALILMIAIIPGVLHKLSVKIARPALRAPARHAQAAITATPPSGALPAAETTSIMPAGSTGAREGVTGATTAIMP